MYSHNNLQKMSLYHILNEFIMSKKPVRYTNVYKEASNTACIGKLTFI